MEIKVLQGQLGYWLLLLKSKLGKRSEEKYEEIIRIPKEGPNRLFEARQGLVEIWEKVSKK